jgi:hypothetical protein
VKSGGFLFDDLFDGVFFSAVFFFFFRGMLIVCLSEDRGSKLLWRLWTANSLELLLDFSLTYVSIIFNYLGPFFLKYVPPIPPTSLTKPVRQTKT